MSYQEKSIKCPGYASDFTLTAAEQKTFVSKAFTSISERCFSCRKAGYLRQR